MISRVLLVLLFVILIPATLAASCSGESFDKVYARSKIIFSGTAVERLDPPPPDTSEYFSHWVEYRFAVAQVWKGTPADTISFFCMEDHECGAGQYEIGVHYLIYTTELYGELTDQPVGLRSGPVESAFIDRHLLGDPVVLRPDLETPRISINDLIELLNSDDIRIYNGISYNLSSIVENREWVVAQLGMILRGERPGKIGATSYAAGTFKDEARILVPDLVALTAKGDIETRKRVFDAISKIVAPEEYFQLLWPKLEEMVPEMRKYMWHWIGDNFEELDSNLQEEYFSDLVLHMNAERDDQTRKMAVRYLAYIWGFCHEIRPILLEIRDNDVSNSVRREAQNAIEKFDRDTEFGCGDV